MDWALTQPGVGTCTARPSLILPQSRSPQGHELFLDLSAQSQQSPALCPGVGLRVIPHPLRGCELLHRPFPRQRRVRSCSRSCLEVPERDPSLFPTGVRWAELAVGIINSTGSGEEGIWEDIWVFGKDHSEKSLPLKSHIREGKGAMRHYHKNYILTKIHLSLVLGYLREEFFVFGVRTVIKKQKSL